MAVDPIKYNQIASVGTLEAGDTVLGEKVNGTTGRLSVGQLQPSDGDKGDITVSASGLTWTIDNDAVTYAKIQNVSATDKLLGRSTSGAGDVEEIACTAAGRALIDDAAASNQRVTLGLSTKVEFNTACTDGDFLYADGGTGVGTYTMSKVIAGDPGSEDTGINVNGVTYESVLKASDLGGTNTAHFIMHRHSTTVPAILVGSRSNSDTSSHTAVTNGQALMSLYAAGWTASHYDLFASMDFSADSSGTISATSAPGKITFNVSADGAQTPSAALTITNDKVATFAGQVTLIGGTGTGTYDFGGASSFEIPNAAAPTVNADGEIAVDTTVTDFSHGIVKYYSGEELGVVAMPIAQFTSPTDTYLVSYNATADEFQLSAPPSGFNPNTTAGTENVISGATAGDSIAVGGNANTLLGYDAGTAITTADNNVAVGHSALKAATTSGTNAVAIGHSALTALTTGTGMLAVGYQAGATYTTQTDCTIIGNAAATANTGSGNTAIGAATMANGTASRANNVIIGAGAGNFGTGSSSVAVGAGVAGRQHGSQCAYVGYDGGRNATGADNVAIGWSALGDGTGGAAANNVAIGTGAMVSGATGAVTFTSATGNTCVGSRAAANSATCLNAIALGRDAVTTIATGATNADDGPGIAIGSAAYPVGFRGDATIFPTAGASSGFWKVKVNGTAYKIELFALA